MEVEEKDAVLWVKAVENYLVELRDRIDSLEMTREELIKSNSFLLTRVEDLNSVVEDLKRKYECCNDGDDSCETIENSVNQPYSNHIEDQNVNINALSNQYTVPETTNHYDEVKPLVYVHQNVLLPLQLHQNPITPQGTSEYCSESGYQTEKEQLISESDDHEIDDNNEILDSESCSESDSDTEDLEENDQNQPNVLDNKFKIENYDNGDEIELNIDIEEGEATGSNCETNATQIEETSGPTVFPFICPKCPRSFSLKRFLSNHLRFCNTDKILQNNSRNDQNTDTNSVVESQISDSKSTSPEVSDGSPQDKSKLRTCNFCVKTFSSRYALKCHERIHTGERPYNCKFCEKKFVQKGHLDQHERIHTGIRPFICKFCGRGFPQQTQMSQHLRRCKPTLKSTSISSQSKFNNRKKNPEEITINNNNNNK